MRFLKLGKAYLNMDRIEMIRHCSGNVIEAVMTDGKIIHGNLQDMEVMDIVEKVNRQEMDSIVQ